MQKEKLDTEIEMAVVINSVLFFSGYEKKNIISDGLWPLLSYCQHFFFNYRKCHKVPMYPANSYCVCACVPCLICFISLSH